MQVLPLSHLGSIFTVLNRHHIGDHHYPPRSAYNQASQSKSDFVDSSGPIFSTYLEMAEEEDKKLAESWQADAEGILVFVRIHFLFPCFKSTYQS